MASMFARRVAHCQPSLSTKQRPAAIRGPVPITTAEFYEHFLRCMPPTGWSESIAVANSGGPDSVCLLFLLSTLLRIRREQQSGSRCDFPSVVHSIHLNHGMQSANSRMETIAASQAKRFGALHSSVSIPWGTPPFHPLTEGQRTEEFLRKARTALLFQTLSRQGVHCIAYAHHADDQVETSIMRLTLGSKEWGASGMRPLRRWGMGDPSDLHLPGLGGMKTWIIRPLLNVPKDRLLATCEANGLEYVIDPTNFQPEVTLRNAIRDYLRRREVVVSPSSTTGDVLGFPQNEKERHIEDAIQRLCTGPSRLPDLRLAVNHLRQTLEQHEVQATKALESAVLPSPPSTILLSVDKLQPFTGSKTQTAIVRRVMRYVSPKPWGSLAAIGHARVSKEDRLASRLFSRPPTASSNFVSGGEIMWQLVTLGKRGEIKYRLPDRGEPKLWLGQRMPPPSGRDKTLHIDLTDGLEMALQIGEPLWTYLYDNRFAIEFNFSASKSIICGKEQHTLAEALKKGGVLIRPTTKFYLPEVIWSQQNGEDVTFGGYHQSEESPNPAWRSLPWVSAEFIRPLSML